MEKLMTDTLIRYKYRTRKRVKGLLSKHGDPSSTLATPVNPSMVSCVCNSSAEGGKRWGSLARQPSLLSYRYLRDSVCLAALKEKKPSLTALLWMRKGKFPQCKLTSYAAGDSFPSKSILALL